VNRGIRSIFFGINIALNFAKRCDIKFLREGAFAFDAGMDFFNKRSKKEKGVFIYHFNKE
jgi:hypothetical protein